MIKKLKGDIWDLEVEAIVIPVNCVGVMGAGLAVQARRKFPEKYFEDYRGYCDSPDFNPGDIKIHVGCKPYIYVINAATKDHWRDSSQLEWVENCLVEIREFAKILAIRKLAISYIGCGYGGLHEKDVEPLIYKYLDDLDCDVWLIDK